MTSHTDPALVGIDRSEAWDRARPFSEWATDAQDLVELWTKGYRRARLPGALVDRAESVLGTWKLLVLMEDWCIDATATMAPLARFADAASTFDLRVLDRDDNLALMDEHLTNGTARSIPVVIVLDETGTERGWWGPRPADLQAWFESAGREMDKDARYRELRKWYARDRGLTTMEEIVALVEQVSGASVVA